MLNSESDEVHKMTELTLEKNPISLIFEYCQSKNMKPTYIVDNEEGSAHCRIFTVTCTLTDLKTTGVGNSKREAKLNAAISMIEQLKTNGLMDMKNFEGKKQKSKRLKLSEDFLLSKLGENPVGFLQEYCIGQALTLPSYVEEPNEFGYSIICRVDNFSCQGVDQKKKQARANAAKEMCEMLIKKNNELVNKKNTHIETEGTSHVGDTKQAHEI